MRNEEKNRKELIDKKPPNPVGTEEENQKICLTFELQRVRWKRIVGYDTLVEKPPNPMGVLRKKSEVVDYLRSRDKIKDFLLLWETEPKTR